MSKITEQDILKMVQHWLNTPVNTYLGSDYGFDKHQLLFQPLDMHNADAVIAKLRKDVPVLDVLPTDAVNLFAIPIGPDKLQIFLQIGSLQINIES